MSDQRLPPGWDKARVQRVLKHYEEQSDEEAAAEDEGNDADPRLTVMEVPTRLVPAVRQVIAKHTR